MSGVERSEWCVVPLDPCAGSHAHLRPAVARVCRAVQLQPNEVAAERRRGQEEDACPLSLHDQRACGEEWGPTATCVPGGYSMCDAAPAPPHSEWGCGAEPWTCGDRYTVGSAVEGGSGECAKECGSLSLCT